ncbi:MAG: HupE/UreJ family protein [Pseudomonadaceae bacterium]|nr:HupE/UreJ family protein [Pseudomonadaceae bacterium]
MRLTRELTQTGALVCVAVVAVFLSGFQAKAHEVRPAYLELTEIENGVFDVLWKQPVLSDRRLPLEPRFPENCEVTQRSPSEHTGDALIDQIRLACDLTTGEIGIDGLAQTLTDVLLRMRYFNGDELTVVLRPDSPSFELASDAPGATAYLWLGVEHLVFGIDHVLFVLALLLLIRAFKPLVLTITAFTIAHSITLALTVLGVVTLPSLPVEACIALSILFVAREIIVDNPDTLARRKPWLIAFLFGLLHGFGFAGALAEIGLPDNALALALLLFNVGIELGQLAVIAAAFLLVSIARRLLPDFQHGPLLQSAASWSLGIVAGMWFVERLAPLFQPLS